LAETKEVQMVVQRAVSLAQNCLAQKKVDCWVEKTVVQMDEMTAVSSAQKMAGRKADCLAETTAVKTVGGSAQKTHLALLTVQASLALE
jgi:hypothetical protein